MNRMVTVSLFDGMHIFTIKGVRGKVILYYKRRSWKSYERKRRYLNPSYRKSLPEMIIWQELSFICTVFICCTKSPIIPFKRTLERVFTIFLPVWIFLGVVSYGVRIGPKQPYGVILALFEMCYRKKKYQTVLFWWRGKTQLKENRKTVYLWKKRRTWSGLNLTFEL